MPAIGFAMLLNIMFKKNYIIFFILGFILATYLHLPVIGIAAVGFIIAIYDYQVNKKVDNVQPTVGTTVEEEDYSDGI